MADYYNRPAEQSPPLQCNYARSILELEEEDAVPMLAGTREVR